MGGIARKDWKCQPAAAGRQEPLAVGSPCALVVGARCQGARYDAGRDRAEASRGSWRAYDGQLGRSILEATRIELQKNSARRRARAARRGGSAATVESRSGST